MLEQRIQKNVSLKDKNTLRVGGFAKLFFEAENKADVVEAVKAAKELEIPFFILGEGSNTLVSDQGFNGLVISFKNGRNFIVNKEKIVSEANVPLRSVVLKAKEEGLSGLEWAVGIPGTLGGAIRGNAGAFNQSMGDIINSVEIFDGRKIRRLSKRDCRFIYRNSVFKDNKDLIVLSAEIALKKEDSVREKTEEYLNERIKKQPKGFSLGSVFKNPEGYSAGKLIEECGLKGLEKGGAKISEEHANFFLNQGSASSDDIVDLIETAKRKVKKEKGVELEEEIEYLGVKARSKIERMIRKGVQEYKHLDPQVRQGIALFGSVILGKIIKKDKK